MFIDEDIDGVPIEEDSQGNSGDANADRETSISQTMDLGEALPSRDEDATHSEDQQSNSDVRFSVQLMPIPSLNMIFENSVDAYQNVAESGNVQGKNSSKSN